MDALQAGIYPMDFVQRYFASFYCVACTLMGNRQTMFFFSNMPEDLVLTPPFVFKYFPG